LASAETGDREELLSRHGHDVGYFKSSENVTS